VTKEEAIAAFGFDPETMGNRHRWWGVIDELDDTDKAVDAKPGYLCVRARDGASNPPDPECFRAPNYFATLEDWFDCTYRYYYFTPLAAIGETRDE
jgi:hypothetical protein